MINATKPSSAVHRPMVRTLKVPFIKVEDKSRYYPCAYVCIMITYIINSLSHAGIREPNLSPFLLIVYYCNNVIHYNYMIII